MNAWHLIPSGRPASGERQMAVDLALLDAHRAHEVPATLRFYTWERPTISLGYAQRPQSGWIARVQEFGYPMIRRPTGGRAVLHAGELTYAVVASPDWGLSGGVAETYRQITEALAEGLRSLGIACALAPGDHGAPGGGEACFASGTRADLLADGRKLVGSAQLRRGEAILQHGSLRLVTLREEEDPLGLTRDSIALDRLLDPLPSLEALQDGLVRGFERRLGLRFRPVPPGGTLV